MTQLNRRDTIALLGMGTAGWMYFPRRGGAQTDLATPALHELAEQLRRTPHDQVFDRAAQAMRAGADYRALLGAAFLAGIHDIRPRSVGSKLHAVMMVDSAYQLAAASSQREARLAALWAVHDFKLSQERDRSEGDWVLPPRPDAGFSSVEAARRELVAAMETWDDARADRAAVGLAARSEHDALFEVLWPYAARCYVDIGHKIIFAAQVERVVRRLGRRYAEPAVRSLVHGLLYRDDSISGSEAAVFEHARELVPRFPEGWLRGHEDPERSATLLRRLRGCDAREAQDLVLAAFHDGLGPATVWDGLRLFASEILHRRNRSALRRHGPVHGVTEVNAFAYAWRTTRSEPTKRLLILQAAGWLPLMKRDIVRFFGPMEEARLDALGDGLGDAVPDLDAVFEDRSPAAARVRLDSEPGALGAYLARMRGFLFHKAFQSHQYKYVAAIHEESALAHPRWASRILAPGVTYVPVPGDPDTEVLRRSLHALRSA